MGKSNTISELVAAQIAAGGLRDVELLRQDEQKSGPPQRVLSRIKASTRFRLQYGMIVGPTGNSFKAVAWWKKGISVLLNGTVYRISIFLHYIGDSGGRGSKCL